LQGVLESAAADRSVMGSIIVVLLPCA
jgi:hypothetical protein